MSLNLSDELEESLQGVSLFNSPVGYSKRPLLYKFESSDSRETNVPSKERYEGVHRTPQNITIESLPFEIRLKISNELSQLDCLNLMLTNKSMYMSSIPRLYQNIIVDENYSQFTKEYDFVYYENLRGLNDHKEFSCSYINSSYNFKRFIKSYVQLNDSQFNNYYNSGMLNLTFPFIKKLSCVQLPDSFNIYDHDLNTCLIDFFGTLSHLRELIWLNDNFSFKFLEAIPNKERLTTLMLNIKFSKFLDNLSSSRVMHYYDSESDDFKLLNFPNLVEFSIKPFETSGKLVNIIDNILIGRNSGKSVGEKLEKLELSRLDKDSTVLIPSCYELISLDPTNELGESEKSTLHALFKETRIQYLYNLKHFSLNNCLVTPRDSILLKNSIDLSKLVTLELKNISEYQRLYGVGDRTQLRRHLSQSFILSIATHLHSLKRLYIDFREAVVDSVPLFLNELSSRNLKALDLIMRFNETKLQSFNGMEDFNDIYAEAIVSGNKSQTLEYLSIEVKEENPFCDINIPIISNNFFEQLSICKELVSLRINPSNRSNSLIELVSALPNLRILDIFGAKAGGSPNLGLGMIHPSVYDEWFKVQHVAIVYLQANGELKYIRINKCIFEINSQSQISPRDGLERWFNKIVRVGSI